MFISMFLLPNLETEMGGILVLKRLFFFFNLVFQKKANLETEMGGFLLLQTKKVNFFF